MSRKADVAVFTLVVCLSTVMTVARAQAPAPAPASTPAHALPISQAGPPQTLSVDQLSGQLTEEQIENLRQKWLAKPGTKKTLKGTPVMVNGKLIYLPSQTELQAALIKNKLQNNAGLLPTDIPTGPKLAETLGYLTPEEQIIALITERDGMLTPGHVSLGPIVKEIPNVASNVIGPESNPPDKFLVNGREWDRGAIVPFPIATAQAKRCGAALTEFKPYSTKKPLEPSSAGWETFRTVLLAFANDCLSSDFAPDGINLAVAKQVVGVVTYGSTSVCPGVIKDGKVWTARHCFINQKDGEVSWSCPDGLDCTTANVRKSLAFTRLSDLTTSVVLDWSGADVTSPAAFRMADDRIGIPLATPIAGLPQVLWDDPPVNSLLWLPGLVSSLDAALYPGQPRDWRKTIRWSDFNKGSCRVLVSDTGRHCVQHRCLAYGGFSGSPLVSGASDATGSPVVKVAGLHVGGMELYPDCNVVDQDPQFNLAVKSQ